MEDIQITTVESETGRKLGKYSMRSMALPKISIAKQLPYLSGLDDVSMPKRYNRQYYKIQQPTKEKDLINDKEVFASLTYNNEEPYEDRKPKELVGEDAYRSYYHTFKNIKRILEQNQFENIQNSVQTNLVQRSERLRILPCKMGLIKLKGDRNSLSIQNQKFGDKYVEMLSEGLRILPAIQDFNFNHNRIKEHGASQLMPLISKQARKIEFQTNMIGEKGLDSILKILPIQQCKIQVLNLEDNNLGDQLIIELCKAMSKNLSVETLNISKNKITNNAHQSLKQLIESNDTLLELYLRWNSIKGSGGVEIFKALQANKNIKVLDFSYNLLGCGNVIAPALKDFIIENKSIQHLDLSANSFTFSDCTIISEALKQNHSIYGFHFRGNFGFVDSKGFLIIDSSMKNFNSIHIEQRIKGVMPHPKPYDHASRFEKVKDICWICDRWQMATFEWIPNKSGACSEEPIFIHFDYEGYEPIFLGKPDGHGHFRTHRMIPTGDIEYFYTANSIQVASQSVPIKQHIEKFRTKVSIADQVVNVLIDETNIESYPKSKPVIEDWYPNFDVLPRTQDPIYIPAKRKKQKRIWTYPISIWAPKYKFDTEELLRKCFERDWQCCKISKFVKKQEEQDQVKDMLWQAYKPMRETYRFYASVNPTGDVFSMSVNPTSDFVNQCQLIDQKQLKLADVDLKFIATCSASSIDYKGNYRNPERSLVRYQMMEFLVRVSDDKYIRFNPQINIVQATKMMLEQCMPHMSQFDSHKWRAERYFVEQCDDVCKKYKWVFDYVYMRNSSRKVKPGQAPFMCLDELKDICNRANLYDENFVERDVNLAFNLSTLTQIDELESDRLFQMQWIEFMEAIARIADKYSPIAIGKKEEKEWTYELRSQQPLYYKLEAFMVHLINTLVDEETKKNWKQPTISMFDEVEEDEYY
ncbi:unnamed protein product (macronuclear) [Paramecium tetraurelia]|uniref:Leucine Rich Repeat family protein n=1 Tax=Paramecium tetraurelia TaxID=5888 RepID=A0E488_PARTE|nr:uncharacterized protein GSPATT00023279001 [Paramecium tetraurelia]CAK90105.1 unnamed protein product [Paramecium tetraurelia]|eukprot:XP_001457502.1 hypothetical protein (macronuclear) [Paramecium tetraurelia strain d4-2]